MNKDIAAKVMDQLVQCHEAIDAAEVIAWEINDPEERDVIRKALAEASGHLYTEAMMSLISQYPDLNPYPRSKQ